MPISESEFNANIAPNADADVKELLAHFLEESKIAPVGWPAQQWDGCEAGNCPNELIPDSTEIVEILSAELDAQPRN